MPARICVSARAAISVEESGYIGMDCRLEEHTMRQYNFGIKTNLFNDDGNVCCRIRLLDGKIFSLFSLLWKEKELKAIQASKHLSDCCR